MILSEKVKAPLLFALTSLALGAVAQDIFTDEANFKNVYLSGVPSFDQRRQAGNVTIDGTSYLVLGLANNGSEFCAPTSALDLMTFLANRGFPLLPPTPGVWQGDYTSGVDGLGQYNFIDIELAFMGVGCQTDAYKNGTYPGPLQTGTQNWLDSEYPGDFTTTDNVADADGVVRFESLLDSMLDGNLVEIFGGWYKMGTDGNQTVYYRNGGHCLALAEGSYTPGSQPVSVGLCDPWTYDPMNQQSPFTYTTSDATETTLTLVNLDGSNNIIPGSEHNQNFEFVEHYGNLYLDGGLVIHPLTAYSRHLKHIYWLAPFQFMNFQQVVRKFASADGNTVTSIAPDPVSGHLLYTTSACQAIYELDPVTGISTPAYEPPDPCIVAYGAELTPYCVSGSHTILQLGRKGAILHRFSTDFPIDEIAYDYDNNEIASLDFAHHRYVLLSRDLANMGRRPLFVWPHGSGRISAEFLHNGHLLMFQHGDPHLYESWANESSDAGGTVTSLPTNVSGAKSFSVDDKGKLYFAVNGHCVVLNSDLSVANNSPFNQLPAVQDLYVNRSVNNYLPAVQDNFQWRNVPPFIGN